MRACVRIRSRRASLLRELRRNMGRLVKPRVVRLLSSDEQFETFGVAKRRLESTFFQLNAISSEFDLFWDATLAGLLIV